MRQHFRGSTSIKHNDNAFKSGNVIPGLIEEQGNLQNLPSHASFHRLARIDLYTSDARGKLKKERPSRKWETTCCATRRVVETSGLGFD